MHVSVHSGLATTRKPEAETANHSPAGRRHGDGSFNGSGREYFCSRVLRRSTSASVPAGDTFLRSSARRKREIYCRGGAVIYAADAPLLLNDFITRH